MLVQAGLCRTCSETTLLVLPRDGSNGPVHMTKMATMAIIISKTFENLFLQKQKAYDFETWYAASGSGALESFMTYFMARSV